MAESVGKSFSWDLTWPVRHRLLTENGAYALLCVYNGVNHDPRIPAREGMLENARAAADEFAELPEGASPGLIWSLTGGKAEDAYAYHDLIEDLERLTEHECGLLLGWVFGAMDMAQAIEPPRPRKVRKP